MKFNTPTQHGKTENLAGGEAFVETPELEFLSLILTSFVKDQFYRSEKQSISEVQRLVAKISDKKFLAKAAIFARTEFGMRSISHVVAVELIPFIRGNEWAKNFFNKVVYRVDDMIEIMSYYLKDGKKPIPNSMKKGFSMAIGKFDEYQLAKYRAEGKSVSLIDVVNLVHPIPNEKNSEALKKLVNGTLKSKDTWEAKLTDAGQKAEDEEDKIERKKQAWKELIESRKIGYFALLRNLRNIIQDAPDAIEPACDLLTDEKLIKKSLVLPFRFTTAFEQVHDRYVITALAKALDISVDNVPKFDGKTLIVLDESGSMDGQPWRIGSLFAAVLYKSNNSDLMMFADRARMVSLNPADSIIGLQQQIQNARNSGGTDFHEIFNELIRVKMKYDRIIILSDMQGWVGYDNPTKTFNVYKTVTGANPIVYSFDLQGYGTLQFPQRNVYCIAGFSEKVFDIMKILEQDKQALINKINQVEL